MRENRRRGPPHSTDVSSVSWRYGYRFPPDITRHTFLHVPGDHISGLSSQRPEVCGHSKRVMKRGVREKAPCLRAGSTKGGRVHLRIECHGVKGLYIGHNGPGSTKFTCGKQPPPRDLGWLWRPTYHSYSFRVGKYHTVA